MRFRSILACLAATPLLVGATEPVTLAPAGPWVLDYAANSCRLSRAFGTPADPTTLLFESQSPESMSMVVMGNQLKVFTGEPVAARFAPDRWPHEGEGGRSADEKKAAALWSRISVVPEDLASAAAAEEKAMRKYRDQRPPPIDLTEVAVSRLKTKAFAATVTHVEIEARRARPTWLRTGPLAKAMTMLQQCTRDQLRSWGVDPAVEDKIARPLWAVRMDRWFHSSDYPKSDGQSVVAYRLLVDANGKPTQCTPLTHFKAPEFPKAVCDILMSRGRFEPAELADGTKVASYYAGTIRWRIG
jgi:hypothetical protein